MKDGEASTELESGGVNETSTELESGDVNETSAELESGDVKLKKWSPADDVIIQAGQMTNEDDLETLTDRVFVRANLMHCPLTTITYKTFST